MRNSQLFILFFLLVFSCLYCRAQNPIDNHKNYHLEKTIRQNNSVFKFWRGSLDSTLKKLIIERLYKRTNVILYNNGLNDGIYKVEDRNGDGFKDLITYYHDYDVIFFFDKEKNRFKDTPLYIPITLSLIDSLKKIYWGYRDAQYAEMFDYSVLYKYIGFHPYFYYQIKYITPEGHSDRNSVTRIELYKFINGNYENSILVKEIKTSNPGKFDYKKYWLKNYKQLVDYSH